MITASQAYIDLLKNSDQLVFADCYVITLKGNVVIRLTSAEVPVTVNIDGWSTTFGVGAIIERSGISTRIGTSVDSLTLTLHPGPDYMVGSVSLLQAVVAGRFDGAEFALYRAAAASWTSGWVGAVLRYKGTLAEVVGTRQSVKITVQSALQLLNVQQPVRKYQPGCTWTLGDADCGASERLTFGAITSIAHRWQFDTSFSATDDAAYWGVTPGTVSLGRVLTGGKLEFTSGANAGFRYPVHSFNGHTITLLKPAGLSLVVGDTFKVIWACDKTLDTCKKAFINDFNFGGFPFIPAADTAVAI